MKKNLFVITESERERILGMHRSATNRQYLSEQEQYFKDATGKVQKTTGPVLPPAGTTPITKDEYDAAMKTGGVVQPAGPQNNPALNTTNQPASNQPASNQPASNQPASNQPASNQNKTIDYKSMGFSDVRACKSTAPYILIPKAGMTLQGAQEKWKKMNCLGSANCKSGTSPFNTELVSALCDGKFSEITNVGTLPIKAPTQISSSSTSTTGTGTIPPTTTTTTTATGTGIYNAIGMLNQQQNQSKLAGGPIADAEKVMPNIRKLDTQKQAEVAAWSKTPAGSYILSLPNEQRERALSNIERRRGDEATRKIRKEIRTALGMA
jgi:hypothetical protein